MSSITRSVKFTATSDAAGDQLAEQLLKSAALVADLPGCELWLVHREDRPDVVWVTETWASREQCDAALAEPAVVAHIPHVIALLRESPQVVAETTPVGGARVVAGRRGARAVSILDEEDLSIRYGLQDTGESRYVREQLGAVQVGLTHYRLKPGRRQGFAHRHAIVEEVYVAIAGEGRIKVDDELFELRPLDAVRVAPASLRELEAGPDGLEAIAFGSHVPGDGEMSADWWPQ